MRDGEVNGRSFFFYATRSTASANGKGREGSARFQPFAATPLFLFLFSVSSCGGKAQQETVEGALVAAGPAVLMQRHSQHVKP